MPLASIQRLRPNTKARSHPKTSLASLAHPKDRTPTLNPIIQAKLRIGAPDDKCEQEADRMAEAVMRKPDSRVGETPPAKPAGTSRDIQRTCSKCEVELQRQTTEDEDDVQRKPIAGQTVTSGPDLAAQITAMSSGGRALPPPTRTFFERRFGCDLSEVRIHDDKRAAESARAINARAYTVGHDIVFGSGEHSSTGEGQRLMAHELTHVVQQSLTTARVPGQTSAEPAPIVRRKTSGQPYATNYAFDTGRVTGAHLKDSDVVRRFNDLNDQELIAYREQARDIEVIEFIGDILEARESEKKAVVRQIVANYAKAQRAGTHRPGGACFAVARERVEEAAIEVAGANLTEGLDRPTIDSFERLWGVHITPKEEWLTLPEEFRGKGSAGAMAFIGKGQLVDQAGIWSGLLEPGAVIQTWRKAKDFDRVKQGKKPSSYGHSFIFVRYVRKRDGAIKGMEIADQGFQSSEVLEPSDYGFWVGANILIAGPRSFVTPRSRQKEFGLP